MKTVALEHCQRRRIPTVTLELDEFELITLVALVEEGRKVMNGAPHPTEMRSRMDAVAAEFTTLLGHLELLAAAND
jgi:hypothetical protein